MEKLKLENGKTKYDLAIKIANDLLLDYQCKREAGYIQKGNFLIPQNIQQVDKALELYLERMTKILSAI